MGIVVSKKEMEQIFQGWQEEYDVYAPAVFAGGGRFSDTDCVRYRKIDDLSDIVFDRKSEFSYKEILMPVSETLFYFTEERTSVPEPPKKGAVIFLRSCDIHALRRLDRMYLQNGPEDFYYSRLRERIKLVLMGCSESFRQCFCVSTGTNRTDVYDAYVELASDGSYRLDIKDEQWRDRIEQILPTDRSVQRECPVSPVFVTENSLQVELPDIAPEQEKPIRESRMWDDYDGRCIACGRCNFVCPTCTCFTMQDIFYTDNGRAGERRRVWASCMVDGYTDVAGGGAYRQKHGQRMRFKVLHKVLDYKKRAGEPMCVGCGRCDDICPEYISFANSINRVSRLVSDSEESRREGYDGDCTSGCGEDVSRREGSQSPARQGV